TTYGSGPGEAAGPGLVYRMNKRGQGHRKDEPPDAPETAEEEQGHDDGHRMQVDRLGKQERSQDVAVKDLDDAVCDKNVGELPVEPPLEKGDERDRECHDRRPDIGDEVGEAHEKRQEHCEPQAHEGEHHVTDRPDDDDLPYLSSDIVGK